MKKFVLLVVPSVAKAYHSFSDFAARAIPTGLISIGAVLEGKGYEVKLIDADAEALSFEDTLRRTIDENPDYVGATTMTATMGITMAFFLKLKESLPHIKIFVGGPHASALPTQTLKDCPAIDFVVKGEGDETISRLMDALEGGGAVSSIAGIAYRDNGNFYENPANELIRDLNTLPLPAYHLLKHSLYRSYGWNNWTSGHRRPLGAMSTGRGCFGRCNFCATKVIFGNKMRYFSLERIKQEIDILVCQYNSRILYFMDDNFVAHRALANQVCEYLIKKGYNKRIEAMVSARTDTVDLATLKHMKQAGIRWICFGVESGNQFVLDRMGKRITLQQIRKAFELANAAGLSVAGNYMMGHIGETRETAMDTINLMCELKQDYISLAIAIPLPGSELYQYCLDKKMKLPPWEEFGSVNSPPIPLNPFLSAKELIELRRLALNSFFIRPAYMMRMLRRFNGLAVIVDFVKMYFALREEIKQGRY